MPTAVALTIDGPASALDMAQAAFGVGIEVVSASCSGDPNAFGELSAATTIRKIVTNRDCRVVPSAGYGGTRTNSGGTTNTNTGNGATDFVVNWFGNHLRQSGASANSKGEDAGTCSRCAATANGTFDDFDGIRLTGATKAWIRPSPTAALIAKPRMTGS